MLTTPALAFAITCAVLCLIVLALVAVATRPGPPVPAHSAPGRHDWLASLDCAREGNAVYVGGTHA